jgi:hypothetical protein
MSNYISIKKKKITKLKKKTKKRQHKKQVGGSIKHINGEKFITGNLFGKLSIYETSSGSILASHEYNNGPIV